MAENKNGLMSKADLNLFFQEVLARLFQKSPKFFRVVGWISVVMAVVGIIPAGLDFLGYKMPETWMPVVGKMLAAAGGWGKLMTSLSVAKPTTEILPFTEKKQIEQSIKADETIKNALK